MQYRAVFFDLGGVVLGSPLHAIAEYEHARGIPQGFINRVVVASGPSGAWSRLERGLLSMEAFHSAFGAECAAAGQAIDARALMERVHLASAPRPLMLEAIRRIRGRGLSTAAITNNWVSDGEGTRQLRPSFDAFVESCVTGVRKPDPRIYRIACDELGVEPAQAVFLDDIGANLKPARALGMTTIKVEEPRGALRALGDVLGFEVLG
jgi:epoxide hydrolase-like predicted phosphatase